MRIAIVTRAKPDAAGTLPLNVRVSHGGLKRYVALGIRVHPRDWNPKKREVRASHPHVDQLNRILRERLATAQAAALELQGRGRHFTADEARGAVSDALHPGAGRRDAPDVAAFIGAMLDDYEARGQYNTAVAHRSALTALTRYLGRRRLAFEDVTPAFVRGYVAHLTTRGGVAGAGLQPNTVNRYVGALRIAAGRAAEDDVPGAEGARRAFRGVKLRDTKTKKDRLTFDQVLALQALDIPPERLRPGPTMALVRDLFVFAFFMGGMRISDVSLLRWEHVDRSAEPWRVRWRQKKTKEGHSLPAFGPAFDTLRIQWTITGPEGSRPSPFVFGLMDERTAADPRRLRNRIGNLDHHANKHLRRLCALIGAEPVGFHGARHGVADHLRRSGLSIYDIQKTLGHSSLRVTESYLRDFDREDLDEKLRRVLVRGDESATR